MANAVSSDQMNKVMACIMAGRTWETRSYEIEDTPEVKNFWEKVTPQIEAIKAAGGVVQMIDDIQ